MIARRVWMLVALAGCVPSAAELRRPVDDDLARRLGSASGIAADDAAVTAALAHPLDETTAVKIALATSPRLAAALDELGVAGGELATALSLGPADIDLMYRTSSVGHELEVDAIQPVLGLIEAPRRRAAARADLAAARATATATALRLAARVAIAVHEVSAAQQLLELRQTAFDAADAAATVRERMYAAGNTTDLAVARDRDAREQARLDLARAQAAVEPARERINALLGLSGDRTKWTIVATLSPPPAEPPALDDLEAAAVTASLDLAAGTARFAGATQRAADERVRAWLPELGVGVSLIDRDGDAEVGPAVRIGLPLFDQRAGSRAQANAELARRDHERTAIAVELRAAARAARVTALATAAEARHIHEVVLPLRQQIVDDTLQHYNAMDADPFALIISRRELVEAGAQYVDALRRYANATAEVTALRRGVTLEDMSR